MAWLEAAPISDPLERRLAPSAQLMFISVGVIFLSVEGFSRLGGAWTADLKANLILVGAVAIALILIRRGHFSAASTVVTAGWIAGVALAFLGRGLRAQAGSLAIAQVALVMAALLAGRAVLWSTFAALFAIAIAGAARDVPAFYATVREALDPGRNALLWNFNISSFVISLLLDRVGITLREAYRRSALKSQELGLALDRLQVSEARFRASLEGSLDGFLLLSAVRDPGGEVTDFTVLEANALAATHLGVASETLPGRLLRDVSPTSTQPGGSFERYVAVLSTRTTAEASFAPAWGSGQVRWVRQQVVPVGDGVAVTVRDLTEQRAAEEREAELRRQFLQSQKMEVVGLLTGAVAHDFNNLLTVIGGHAELLASDLVPPEQKESVEEILLAHRRAAELTANLLAFSHKRAPAPRVLDLDRSIRQASRFWQRLCGSAVTFDIDLPAGCRILADAGELEQILMNLIVNARDAMPHGGRIRLRGGLERWTAERAGATGPLPPGRWSFVTVEDSGSGMDAAIQARIFEPFFTTKPVGRGTGLGLSTVARLLREQGGGLTVESAPGRGTTFRAYWPAVEATADAEQTTGVAALPQGGTETLLMVDDDPGICRLYEGTLRRLGYQVLIAGNGERALELADRHHVDLLVTDLVLPDRRGVEVAAALRRRWPALPVVVVTGYGDEQGLEVADLVLRKPVTLAEVAFTVRRLLDGGRDVAANSLPPRPG